MCLTVANQFIAQMEETIRDAVFGNMGTIAAFRVGPLDAEFMERVFAPVFTQEDLQNIAFGQYYITLQIDNMGSKPFSAQGLGPIAPLEISLRTKVIEMSRANFARPKDQVEEAVREFFGYGKKDGAKTIQSIPVPPTQSKDIPRPSLREYQKNEVPKKPASDPKQADDQNSGGIPSNRVRTYGVPRPAEKPQSQPVSKPLPTINSFRKIEPKALPQKNSESLQSLLGKLDTMTVVDEPKQKAQEAVRTPQAFAPKSIPPRPTEEKVIEFPKPVPVITSDPKLSRVATPEKKLALKDILAKAMEAGKTNPVTPPPALEVPNTIASPAPISPVTTTAAPSPILPPKIPTPPPIIKTEAEPVPPQKPQVSTFTKSESIREIPEDILRRVLE